MAIRVVKAFVREDHEREKFKRSNNDLTQAFLSVGMRIIAIMPVMIIAMNAATVAGLYFGGRMVMGGSFDLGDLQAFLNYIFQILMSVMMVAMSLLQLSRSQACAARIQEVLDTEPSVEDRPEAGLKPLPAPRGEVEFRDVSFKYLASGTGDDVLSHISFSVKPGQFVALVGGTGTGKSSLVNLIPRFYDVTEGDIRIDGEDVRHVTQRSLRQQVGVVQQDVFLFADSVLNNIRCGKPDATEEEVVRAAKLAEIYDDIMAMPDGFDTYVGERGTLLSGGQKQRISIARIFLKNPPVLILDEATSALDSVTEAKLQATFDRLSQGRTTIIIAHRLSTVRNADRIAVIEEGRVAELGSHRELMEKNGAYAALVRTQELQHG